MQTPIKTKSVSVAFLFLLFIFNAPATAQDIWGMTKYGGEHDKGVIFKMDENATSQEVVFSFKTVQNPEGGLTEYKDGVFYGLSSGGGKHNYGIIYKFEADDGSFTKIIDFDGEVNGKDGVGKMVYASDGKMYGTTVTGGKYDKGVLFEFDPVTELLVKKFDFDGTDKGAEPLGSLVEGLNGKLYGTASMGGVSEEGVLFSFDITTGNFTKIIDFNGATSGANPMGSLINASDGMLYGMTRWGGANNDGVIFKLNPENNQVTALFEFDDSLTGRNPQAALTEASNGKLYGLTPFGGTYNLGVLFEYDVDAGTFIKKYEFSGMDDSGMNPFGSLVQANNSKLYGLIAPELHLGNMLFEFNPSNDVFQLVPSPTVFPREFSMFPKSLTLDSNDMLYFIINANQNDIKNENNVYEFDPAKDEYSNHFKFSGITTGEFPHGSLFQDVNGMLFGTTYEGGKYHQGVLFKIDPVTYKFSKVLDFNGSSKGANPNGGIIQGDNKKLYGLTSKGGAFDKGVIYELDPESESYTKVFDFDGVNGENPDGDLVKATNGKFYGVTTAGGAYDEGVLFEIDPVAGTYNKIVDFQEVQYGKKPVSNALVAASDGSVYGTTLLGGLFGEGVLFEYNPANGILSKRIDFEQPVTGIVPENLVQGNDGMLYGHVKPGFIIKIDPVAFTVTKVVDNCDLLNSLTGRLLQAENGKFYGLDRGLIWYRATDFTGGIHEFDVDGNNYSQLLEFDGENGSNPENCSLIQLKDFSPPVANCKDITLFLDEKGEAVLNSSDVDDGSTGTDISFSLNKTAFSCSDVGENVITLTVTDSNGLQSACNATVEVADTIPPSVFCHDIEVFLDADGNANIEAADVDGGSTDACGIETRALNRNSFSCDDLGENQVQLQITDVNGNSSFCEAIVTVTDAIAPEITCQDSWSAYLEPDETQFLVDNEGWDAVAADNCTLEGLNFTINGEDVANRSTLNGFALEAGTYEVIWTAADKSNNFVECTSEVSIKKRPTSLQVLKNEIDEAQETIRFEVALTDDILVHGIEGKTLVFSAGEFIQTAVTNNEGVASLDIPLKSITSDTVMITAVFEEDNCYTGCNSNAEVMTDAEVTATLKVNVYPNPFFERLNFEFIAPESADARIDMYDAAGRLVNTVFSQPVEAGMIYRVKYSPRNGSDSYLLYRIKIGEAYYNGKVLYRK